MKKLSVIIWTFGVIVGLLVLSPLASAVQQKNVAPVEPSTTVAGIGQAPVAGNPVTLKGKIVEDLGSSFYRFHDETGDIKVKINSEVMVSKSLSPESNVEIHGVIVTPKGQSPQVNVGLLTVKETFVQEIPAEAK